MNCIVLAVAEPAQLDKRRNCKVTSFINTWELKKFQKNSLFFVTKVFMTLLLNNSVSVVQGINYFILKLLPVQLMIEARQETLMIGGAYQFSDFDFTS